MRKILLFLLLLVSVSSPLEAKDFTDNSDIRTFALQFLPEVTSSDLNYCSSIFDAISVNDLGENAGGVMWFANLINTIPNKPYLPNAFVIRNGKFEADVTAENIFDSNDSTEFIASSCAKWAGEVYAMSAAKPNYPESAKSISLYMKSVDVGSALSCLTIGGVGFVNSDAGEEKGLFGAILQVYGQRLHDATDNSTNNAFSFFGKSAIWDEMQQGGFEAAVKHLDFVNLGDSCLSDFVNAVTESGQAN